jgi:lysosomal Pro-X carboxypeptidase
LYKGLDAAAVFCYAVFCYAAPLAIMAVPARSTAAAALVALLLVQLPASVRAEPRWGGGLAARCEWQAKQRGGAGGSCQHIPAAPLGGPPHPGVPNCTEKFFEQVTDHFSFTSHPDVPPTFQQRYFINDQYWRRPSETAASGPIFYYTGNEANVELYVNATGLIWENCAAFNCLIVFAEHRYWGKSLLGGSAHANPADPAPSADLSFLTHEQALADYASLLHALKLELGAADSPVISFGGSYGGMLSYWFRQKYPGSVDGAIAASAPVLAFKGQRHAYASETFWAVVTRDATPAAGSIEECAPGVRAAWKALAAAGATPSGRRALQQQLNLCQPLSPPPPSAAHGSAAQGRQDGEEDEDEEMGLVFDLLWFAIDTMSMGDFPYASNYLTNGGPLLAPFPMRTGCEHFKGLSVNDSEPAAAAAADAAELIVALGRMAGVFNNATKDQACYELPTDDEDDAMWDYLW